MNRAAHFRIRIDPSWPTHCGVWSHAVLLIVCLVFANVTFAGDEAAALAPRLESAATQYVALPESHAAKLHQDVQQAVALFHLALIDQDPAVLESWNDYLELPELARALADHTSASDELLRKLVTRLSVNQPGIDRPELLKLRAVAERYLRWQKLDVANLPNEYSQRIAALRTSLEEYAESPDQETSDRIGDTLRWLVDLNQAPELVTAVRQQYSHPNGIFCITDSFINQYAVTDVASEGVQVMNVLGTINRGWAVTSAKTRVEFHPNDQHAEIQLRLIGSSRSNHTVGRNGPATIYSSSETSIDGTQRFLFDPVVGLVAKPAEAFCKTDAHIKNIHVETKHFKHLLAPLANKVAQKKSSQLHAAAEREAARQASHKVEEQLEEQTQGPIEKLQTVFKKHLHTGPLRLNELPLMTSRTSEHRLELKWEKARANELAAPTAPPAFDKDVLVGGALHQSFVNNSSADYLFGKTEYPDEAFEKLAVLLAGEVPSDLRVFSNSTPWSIIFNRLRPFTIAFESDAIDITVHTDAWRIDGVKRETALDIHAKYRIENSRFGIVFHREGQLDITPRGQHSATTQADVELLAFVTKKAEALLPQSGRFNNLVLPSGGSFGPVAALRLNQLECGEGWMLLGFWTDQSASNKTANKPSTK